MIDAGDDVIQKERRTGIASLSAVERLIDCLWVADCGMRNAGDLEAARDVDAHFQTEAAQLSKEAGLRATHEAFALSRESLEREYFGRFEGICDEIRGRIRRDCDEE
jgi:hypothetical protein